MANNYKSLYSGQEIDSAVKRTATNANDIKKLDTKIDTHANNQVLDHPDGSVTADKIAVGAVTSDKLGTGAVTSNKLDTSAVIASKIAIGAVITSRISDEAVTTEKIADGAATAEKIADESILEKHLSTEVLDRIDANKFDGTIINTDIDTYEFPVSNDLLIYKINDTGLRTDFGGVLLVNGVYNKYVSNTDPEDVEYELVKMFQTKIVTKTGEIHTRHATRMTTKKPVAWSDWESVYVTEADLTEVLKDYIKTDDTAGINITGTVETSAVILRSSTEGSTKRFGLTIDDSGAISVQEIEFE